MEQKKFTLSPERFAALRRAILDASAEIVLSARGPWSEEVEPLRAMLDLLTDSYEPKTV